MTINGISGTPLYGELYTSCNTLTTCFGPIQGNNINLTLTPNTTYLLKLYANKEMLFSNTVQLQLADGLVSGLEENQLENGLQVYPNPAQSVVYVKGAQNQTATLFDFSGKIIEVAQVKEGQLQVGQLPNGLYFLEICSERKRFTIVR